MMDGTNKAECSYTIVPITNNDKQTVATFLREFFFRDEPLNVAIGLLEESDSATKLEHYCTGYLQYGISLTQTIKIAKNRFFSVNVHFVRSFVKLESFVRSGTNLDRYKVQGCELNGIACFFRHVV